MTPRGTLAHEPGALVLAPAGAVDLSAMLVDHHDARGGATLPPLRLRGGLVILTRVLRQFHGEPAVTLERTLVFPDVPTLGSRIDLSAHGVAEPLAVLGITLREIPAGPGFRPPSVDVVLAWESAEALGPAIRYGWQPPGEAGSA